MIRVLFGILAIILVVMALLLDVSWLFLVIALVAVAAVGAATVVLLRRREAERPQAIPKEEQEDDLRSLGIMDIRPREEKARPRGEAASDADETGKSESPSENGARPKITPPQATPVAKDNSQDDEEGTVEEEVAEPDDEMATPVKQPESAPRNGQEPPNEDEGESTEAQILQPLLRSMKAALEAHTVCLLKQKDLALEYYIVGLVNDRDKVRTEKRFVTRAPLLTATMAQRPVSVRHVGKTGVPRTSLGYYREPVGVEQLALAPVPRRDAVATYFLVADTREKDALGSQYHRTLLAQYAELVSTLLDELEAPEDADPTSSEPVRPRREIIQEEMEEARASEAPLSLALVHLNRSEMLADDGVGAVASAERALRRRLEEATPEGRVERFGELTFGIFQTNALEEVESWATQLQRDLDTETGILEGGISIGVAMLDARHGSAEAFRADATTALQESYQTGACILVE